MDFELASIFIKQELDIPEIQHTFSKQYVPLKEGRKWFIRDFIDFQYGELNPENRAHNSVLSILQKEGVYKGLISPIQGRKDKDKDKDKDKEKERATTIPDNFAIFWQEYPRKEGKGVAMQSWLKLKIDNGTFEAIMVSLSKYKKSLQWMKDNGQYIPHPSTWLNGKRWEDEPMMIKEADDWKG